MDLSDFSYLRPLHDKAFVEVENIKEQVLASGLILPATRERDDKNRDFGVEGYVVAVGPGRFVGKRFIETQSKAGQRVFISIRTSQMIPRPHEKATAGKTLYQLYDYEILAVIEEPTV